MRVSQLLLASLGALALVLTSTAEAVAATTRGAGAGRHGAGHGTRPVSRHGRPHRPRRRATPSQSTNATAADTSTPGSGGAGVGDPSAGPGTPSTPERPTVSGSVAKIVHGEAYAPSDAPTAVKQAIWAGNAIRHKPYVLGGGHGTFNDSGYDCSGTVSYVLHSAGLIKASMDSVQFEGWGQSGLGQWITVYTNDGHAFVQIAGIRLDTSPEQDPGAQSGDGPRWRPLMRRTSGYMARHLASF